MAFSRVDLPAPFGPDDADDLARRNLEVDALQDLVGGAVAGDDAAGSQSGPIRRPRPCGDPYRRAAPARSRPPVVERAFGQMPALGQHDHVVAKPRDHVHVVLDQQDGDAVGDQALQVLADLAWQASG